MRLLGAAVAAMVLAAATFAGHAAAEDPPPEKPTAATPVGEDVSFVLLGAVGERVSIDFYRAAAAQSKILDRRTRRQFRALAKQKVRQWRHLNAALGEDALTDEDFTSNLPPNALKTSKQIFRFGERLERLLAGVYLSGLRDTSDPATRVMLARRLVADLQNLAVLRGLRGASGRVSMPAPLSVEYAGTQIDQLLAEPS